MKSLTRRRFIRYLAAAPIGLAFMPTRTKGMDCNVQHPFVPPSNHYQGQCPVCGMVRSMWARTWIIFDEVNYVSQVCSFHCLADWMMKSGQDPTNVMLTIYHQPDTAVPAADAFIVMGSTAAGTMSPVSKIVFADRSSADEFAKTCNGQVVDYNQAVQSAKASVQKENQMINARRLKKGKIVEPEEGVTCPVCGMYPKRYPYGKCQIKPKDGQTIHFCSTQCLFAFLGKQAHYLNKSIDPMLIWVVDRNSGMWISGRTAFYVIGSKKVFGPMGYEALPFNSLKEAQAFTATNGGRTSIFSEVTIQQVVPNWTYSAQ